eukprot:UN06803
MLLNIIINVSIGTIIFNGAIKHYTIKTIIKSTHYSITIIHIILYMTIFIRLCFIFIIINLHIFNIF